MEKHFVFDDTGKLKEVRGYGDDEVLRERWEVVYDESDRVVGLRPLAPEEVIPSSTWEKIKRFWKKPKPLSQILSIDFIGLIQYIGLINKINEIATITNIKNIESVDLIDQITKILEIINIKNIESVDLIDEITKIGEISTIRDLTHTPKSFITNPFFQSGFTGWIVTGTVHIIPDGGGIYFDPNVYGSVHQYFPIPLGVDWMSEFYFYLQGVDIDVDLITFKYFYTDETSNSESFQVSGKDAEKKTLSPTSGKYIRFLMIEHTLTQKSAYIEWLTTVF